MPASVRPTAGASQRQVVDAMRTPVHGPAPRRREPGMWRIGVAAIGVGPSPVWHRPRGQKKPRRSGAFLHRPEIQSNGINNSATMLMILISGLTAGPAVSLYGS